MWRKPSLASLLATVMLITSLDSNAANSTSDGSDTAQCNIRLLIPEHHESDPVETKDDHISLQGSGPLNPFNIHLNGELATPSPILSGCFDIRLGFQARPPRESGLTQIVIEPL